MSAVMKSDLAAQRQAFYEGILKKSSTPLWEVLHNLVTPVPKTPLVPSTTRQALCMWWPRPLATWQTSACAVCMC